MFQTINYQLLNYHFDNQNNQWLIHLQNLTTLLQQEISAKVISEDEKLLLQLSVQDLKIIYFLKQVERNEIDNELVDKMLDILFWRQYREDGIELTDDRSTWPVTPLCKNPLCKIVAQDYIPRNTFSDITIQYYDNSNIVKAAAKYIIGDDDFVARLSFDDIERLVAIVFFEQMGMRVCD